MQVKRVGIFETNSSSTHSLSLGSEPVNHKGDDRKETIVLGSGEYGWGYNILTTWLEKADYLGVEVYERDGRREMLEEAIASYYPNIIIEYSESGDIDHQSEGKVWSRLNNIHDVINFLFGNSEIIIDHDNH